MAVNTPPSPNPKATLILSLSHSRRGVPDRLTLSGPSIMRSGHCWLAPCRCANNAQTRSNRVSKSGQPFLTIGGGGGAFPFPLPRPAQPETLTATRVATKANNTFFIGVPLSSRPAMHFVPRSTLCRVARMRGSLHPEIVGVSSAALRTQSLHRQKNILY
jgi:hypothetical protein